MRSVTHVLFGLLLYLGFVNFYSHSHDYLLLVIVLIASILPDIDTISLFFSKNFLQKFFLLKHRGITHSWIFLFLFSFLVQIIFTDWHYTILFFSSYMGHLFLDALNPSGVPIFYPFRNIQGFIKYGSIAEYLIIAAIIVVDIALIILSYS